MSIWLYIAIHSGVTGVLHLLSSFFIIETDILRGPDLENYLPNFFFSCLVCRPWYLFLLGAIIRSCDLVFTHSFIHIFFLHFSTCGCSIFSELVGSNMKTRIDKVLVRGGMVHASLKLLMLLKFPNVTLKVHLGAIKPSSFCP